MQGKRTPGTLPLMFVVVAFALSTACWEKRSIRDRPLAPEVSLCDLRNNLEQYANREVQVRGWIYTDLERFVIENGRCAVAVRLPEPLVGSQMERFERLLQTAKRNGFNTADDLFVVLIGKSFTTETRIGNEVWRPGFGAGQSPTLLLVRQVICSAVAPMTNTDETAANALCQAAR